MLADFKRDIQPRLDQNPFIRLPCDEIPKWDVLVYEWLTDDFLKLIRKDIPSQARRTVLKAALRGIAELHSKDIVHLGKSFKSYPRIGVLTCFRYQAWQYHGRLRRERPRSGD